MKKAFSMIEIIIALVISAMIGVYMLNQKQKSDFTTDVSEFSKTLVGMIETGIIDSTIGYASSANSYCGGTGDYTDITPDRVRQCIGWKNYGSDGDATLHGRNLLGAYTNGAGCSIDIDEDSSDAQTFYVFVDCSNLNYDNGSSRYKKYVEDRIDYVLRSKLSTIYQSTDRNAKSMTTGGGNSEDGQIKMEFKK